MKTLYKQPRGRLVINIILVLTTPRRGQGTKTKVITWRAGKWFGATWTRCACDGLIKERERRVIRNITLKFPKEENSTGNPRCFPAPLLRIWLILGVNTCDTHQCRKKRKQRTQHNRLNSLTIATKQRKKFTGFYSEVNPTVRPSCLLERLCHVRNKMIATNTTSMLIIGMLNIYIYTNIWNLVIIWTT